MAPSQLQARLFRNDGPMLTGGWRFVEIPMEPWFTPSYQGCASWRDVDNDGDLDLFMSGLAWDEQSPKASLKVSRIYRNDHGPLTPEGAVFLNDEGIEKINRGESFGPNDGLLTHRVTWVDIDHDSFADAILETVDEFDVTRIREDHYFPGETGLGIWINRQGRGT